MNGRHFIVYSTSLLLNSVAISTGGRKKKLVPSHFSNSRLNLTPPQAKLAFYEHEASGF